MIPFDMMCQWYSFFKFPSHPFIVNILLYGNNIYNNIINKIIISKILDFIIKYKSFDDPLI